MDKQGPDTEEIIAAMNNHDFKKVRQAFRLMDAADISATFKDLDIVQSIVLFRLVPGRRRPEVFAFLSRDRQEEMLERLPDLVVVSLLNDMEPVDRTRLLEEMPAELSSRFLQMLSPEEREMATRLLSYPEDSVGRLMSPEFVGLRSGMNVTDALAYIRWNSTVIPESLLLHLFVVNDQHQFLGHVSLGALVVADPPSLPVDEIMDTLQQPLSVYDHESEAVDYFRKYDRPYIPVVDEKQTLVGIVEADDVFDVAEEDATEDIQQFGGQGALEESYFETPLATLLRKRAGWLALVFVAMMATANAMEIFKTEIGKWKVLVFFLPLVMSSGGNSGSQAAALMIRGLAVKEVELRDWFKVFRRELLIGLGLGLLLGILGFSRAWFGGQGPMVGLILALTLMGIVIFGAMAGAMLPFLLKGLRLDPAVSSSPVIAAMVDIVAIFMLFNIAIYLVSMFGGI